MPKVKNYFCHLCERTMKASTTEHHLIPRTCHKNRWFKKNFTREQMAETISLCRDCHNELHELVPSEKELGRHFNTIDKIRSHPRIAKFLIWIAKQK